MKKFLIFRTDRVGDFILSSIIIKSIKRNEPKSHITVISSEKNYEYIKKISFVDKVIKYPNNFYTRILFFYKIFVESFDFVLCLDGKKRSILACIINRSKFKIISTTKKIYKIVFFTLRKNMILSNEFDSRISEFKHILDKMNYDFVEEDMNIFENEDIITDKNYLRDISLQSYILLHLDEKWITENYRSKKGIRNFLPINADVENIYDFIKKIIFKSNCDVFISSGENTNRLINELKQKFNKKNIIDYNKRKIIILENLNYFDLKFIIKKANLIITCHGSPSHVASAFNTKIIDIFDEKTKNFYEFYTKHLRNYNYVFRQDFKSMSMKILEKI